MSSNKAAYLARPTLFAYLPVYSISAFFDIFPHISGLWYSDRIFCASCAPSPVSENNPTAWRTDYSAR